MTDKKVRFAHYASTFSDYDGCTMDLEACGKYHCVDEISKDTHLEQDWKTHDQKKVTCPKCLRILAKTDFKTVTELFFDDSSVILYSNTTGERLIQIGEIDLTPITIEAIKKLGFTVKVKE